MELFFRFCSVGVLNSVIGYAIIFGCMYLIGLSPVLSNILGYSTGLTLSFLLNRLYTFRSNGNARQELIGFLGVFVIAYLSNLGTLKWLLNLNTNEAVSQVAAGMIYVGISFILNKIFVFKNTK